MPTRRARKRVLIRRLGIPLAVLTLIAVMVVAPASANLLGSNDGNLVVHTSGKSLLSFKTSGYRADGRGFAIAPSSHSAASTVLRSYCRPVVLGVHLGGHPGSSTRAEQRPRRQRARCCSGR